MRDRLLACLLVTAAWAVPAAGQPPPAAAPPASAGQTAPAGPDTYLGKPIEAVRLFLDGVPTAEPALTELLETRVGRPLAVGDVRESIAHLHSLGRFQDVRVDATLTPSGGVSLRIDLVPLQTVQAVDFRGTVGLSRGLLRSTLTERYGAAPTIGRAADAIRTLEALYRDHGYLRSTIRVAPETRQGRTVLLFTIDAGVRATIADVVVEGDPRMRREEFLAQLRARRGDPYEEPVLQRRLDEAVEKLRRRGYYEASASSRASVSEDGTSVNLTIDMRSGPRVTVRFEGSPLPADRLSELVPIVREGSASEDLLEDSIVAIRSYLQRQGYWKAEASWRREESNDALALVFRIQTGARYYAAQDVTLTGNQSIATEELRTLIALKPGELFIESGLSLASAAITELYRQRGFATAAAKYAVVEAGPATAELGAVRSTITISEGPRTLVGGVVLTGNAAVAEAELRPLIKLIEGQPFYQPQVNADREAIIVDYLNNGFASADVTAATAFSDDRSRVDVTFTIQEGPQGIVDHILIVGNTHTDPRVILNEIKLKPGQPLGREDLVESQRALSALGLFRRVRITELRHGSEARQDVLVTVDEAPMTTIGYGGGVEANQELRSTGPNGEAREQLAFAPRGFFNIGRRNVGGRNRTVDLYTRVSLRPDGRDNPSDDGSGFGFLEYRVVGTFRQPRAFWSSDAALTAATEQGRRTSFNFARKGVNADMLRRLNRSMRLSARYSFSTTRTFDEQLDEDDRALIDRLFPQVRLSTFSGAVAWDTRDDVLEPHRGGFLSLEGSVAARSLGGQVGFLKTYVQGYWFREILKRRPIVFATRAAIGLADGFERQAPTDAAGVPIPGESVEDLPASERFFAGGDTSIRGFALDTVGTAETISANGFPRGGNAVLIFNGELRVPVWREFGAALFLDAGSVFQRTTDVDLGELRGALGLGLRYRSPVGPIRLDVGFKMDRREFGGQLEPRAVWHFSIGQAF